MKFRKHEDLIIEAALEVLFPVGNRTEDETHGLLKGILSSLSAIGAQP